MKLYSSLDGKVVDIVTENPQEVKIYSCGPTVYYDMHLGNIRAYVDWDILHRAFEYCGYSVKRIMNITDVGHMTSSNDYGSDFGEEKMDKEALKEGLQPLDIANKYIDSVLRDFRMLNILTPSGQEITEDIDHTNIGKYGWTRATEYIDEMISMIKRIEGNGYTYETAQALYFDVTKIPDYTIFTGQELNEKAEGMRENVNVDPDKKNPADFVLWMKRVGRYQNHIMNWDSPWGNGFPGWHIECSAMGTSVLGEHIDIHTGGVDHIPVHHTNERAQNIAAFGQPVVKYWIHNEWLVNKDNEKLSKSKGADTLKETLERGYDPMDIRYFFMAVNYHSKINFSFNALDGARSSRLSLMARIKELGNEVGNVIPAYADMFKKELENNLNMSGVLAVVNEMLRSQEDSSDKLATMLNFDKVLGLNLKGSLGEAKTEEYIEGQNAELDTLLKERQKAKLNKDYEKADAIRNRIANLGYMVIDSPSGQSVKRI